MTKKEEENDFGGFLGVFENIAEAMFEKITKTKDSDVVDTIDKGIDWLSKNKENVTSVIMLAVTDKRESGKSFSGLNLVNGNALLLANLVGNLDPELLDIVIRSRIKEMIHEDHNH